MNNNHEKRESTPFATETWADWLVVNKRLVALMCAAALLLVIAGIWFLQARSSQRIRDFDTADILAQELQKNPKIFDDKTSSIASDQDLATLKELDDKYSILQSRFDGLIAEEMLLRDKKDDLDPYAKRTIERLKMLGLNDFAEFSEVARLTGLQNYKEALKLALSLKAELSKQSGESHQYLLKAFLLLHIATLNQKLGLHDAMMQTTLELKEYLGLNKRATPLSAHEKELASQVLSHLQDRQSSLLEFIEEMPKASGT